MRVLLLDLLLNLLLCHLLDQSFHQVIVVVVRVIDVVDIIGIIRIRVVGRRVRRNTKIAQCNAHGTEIEDTHIALRRILLLVVTRLSWVPRGRRIAW